MKARFGQNFCLIEVSSEAVEYLDPIQAEMIKAYKVRSTITLRMKIPVDICQKYQKVDPSAKISAMLENLGKNITLRRFNTTIVPKGESLKAAQKMELVWNVEGIPSKSDTQFLRMLAKKIFVALRAYKA